MDNISIAAGIDTSKAKLDIALHGREERWQVDNVRSGWRHLAQQLDKLGVRRAGIEASGGYERGVVAFLRACGLDVFVLQPAQVKAYARMRLRRAKNDKIDASHIAACTALLDVREGTPDERLCALAEQLTFVEQTEEDIVRGKTRLEKTQDARLRRVIAAEIERCKKRRDKELRRIAETLRQHDDLAQRLDLVLSIPGIGERTGLALIIRMPELGRVSREQAAALVGLAPFDNESGTFKGKRSIAGGRARLRRSLFAAALPAAFRWNKSLIALYRRLTERGKPHKLALIACARKLLAYANTVVARATPWANELCTQQPAAQQPQASP